MWNLAGDKDTICALSSAPGLGGIAVLRVSGPDAFEIVRRISPGLNPEIKSHRIYKATIQDTEGQDLDEALFSVFEEGRSYTGERTVEISCHGNPQIVAEALKSLQVAGARIAQPGEFTRRAFLNNRIDLIQAEAVLGLIESRSKIAGRVALRQLQGSTTRKILELEDDVLWLLARFEASIDFSLEDLPVLPRGEVEPRLDRVISGLRDLIGSYKAGRVIREGLRVALLGRPNVGKSSTLNSLLGRERAIVNEAPGTTRDVIEVDCMWEGHLVTLVDTAGVRESQDPVEQEGVDRSRREIENADLLVFLTDLEAPNPENEVELLKGISAEKRVIVGTKADRADEGRRREMKSLLEQTNGGAESAIWVSNKTGEGLESLRKAVLRRAGLSAETGESAGVTQARQFECLSGALEAMKRAEELWKTNASFEFTSLELREALSKLHEVLGKRFDDDIVDRIFKDFCIGK